MTLACETVPRVNESLGLLRFDNAVRRECRRRYWALDHGERVREQLAEGRRTLLAHPAATLGVLLRELRTQMLAPSRLYHLAATQRFYPAWLRTPSWVLGVFWLLAAAALVWTARRDLGLAGFLLCSAVLVMAPAANTAHAGARLRFPIDLFSLPLVAALVASTCARIGPDSLARILMDGSTSGNRAGNRQLRGQRALITRPVPRPAAEAARGGRLGRSAPRATTLAKRLGRQHLRVFLV
jgi:hypothetical protein